jgi:hypothetical protein
MEGYGGAVPDHLAYLAKVRVMVEEPMAPRFPQMRRPHLPRCAGQTAVEQYGNGGPMGVQVTAGGEVRAKQAFQESEGPGEPSRPLQHVE